VVGVSLGRRDQHRDAGTVQQNGAGWLVNERIQKPQWQSGGAAKRRHLDRLAFVIVRAAIGCEELDLDPLPGDELDGDPTSV
jgi:hypothetical protein